MKDIISVIVIGGIHHNTLGVIRSLGEIKCEKINLTVLLITSNRNKNIVSTSKYIKNSEIVYFDLDEEVYDWLIRNSDKLKGSIVICCSDGSAEVVMNHSKELSKWYKVPSVDMDVQQLMLKDEQARIARNCGLITPKSIVFSKCQELEWEIFPCITKPEKSVFGKGKGDIYIARDKKELQSVLETTESNSVQIQEYIKKKKEFQLIGCSLDGGNTIIIPGFTDILRQPKNTNTGYLLLSPINELKYNQDAVYSFIKTIGYSGLFSVEFIRDENDNDYFLEINMRNDGNAYCLQCGGVNLPYIWAYYQKYGHLPESELNIQKSLYFIPDFWDLKLGIKSVGVIKWIIQFIGAKAHSLFNLRDINPFIFEFMQRFKTHFCKRNKRT